MRLKELTKFLLVFAVFFAIFFLARLSIGDKFFGTDDPYYHAKHSLLMAEERDPFLVRPWLELNYLNFAPNDPYWAYHLLGAEFISLFGVFGGIKILASLIGALVFSSFYFLLKSFGARIPLVWTFFYFSSSAFFITRLLPERPYLLAALVLPLGYFLAVRKKFFLLFSLAFAYALFYNLAPMILLPVIVYSAAEFYYKKNLDFKPFIAAAGGLSAGILVHPHALNYVYVMFVHIFMVFYLKITGVNLGVGNEMRSLGFYDFIRYNFIVLVLYILSLVIFLGGKLYQKNKKIIYSSLLAITIFWLPLMFAARRSLEYWMPFSCLFIALVFSDFAASADWAEIKKNFQKKTNTKISAFFIYAFLAIFAALNIAGIFSAISKERKNDRDYYSKEASDWLVKNTPAKTVVFYDNWSFFPLMFFYNDHNRYLIGMDPTFAYNYNGNLFWIWKNIGHNGVYCGEPGICANISPKQGLNLIAPAVKNLFSSDYILAAKEPESRLVGALQNNKKTYEKVFENKLFILFKII